MGFYVKNNTGKKKRLAFTQDQINYLVDIPLAELHKARLSGDTRIQITESPTGSGKSTLTTHEFLPKYLQQNQDAELIFIVCFDSAVVSALYDDVVASIKNNYRGERGVDVMNSDKFEYQRKYPDSDSDDITIIVVTTSKFANIYENYDPKNSKYHVPDLLIIDEVHREMACADVDDTMLDFGVNYSKFEPKRLGIVQRLSELGMVAYGLTGTPSKSQVGASLNGNQHFKLISKMPKSEMYNKTTYCPDPTTSDLRKTLENAIVCYRNLYDSVMSDINTIKDETWTKINDIGISKIAPRMIIKTSPKNSKEDSGLTIDDAMDEVRYYAEAQQADFIVYSSGYQEYSYLGTDGVYRTKHDMDLNDMVRMANSRTSLLRPTYVIVLNAGNVGINLSGLSVVAYLSKPSQDQVYRTQVQLMARSNRMPFDARDHKSQALAMSSIQCSRDEQYSFIEYVSKMVVSAIFIPDGSINLKAAIDSYCDGTLDHLDGRQYYHSIVFDENKTTSLNLTPTMKQKWVFDQGDINNIARKTYCQACVTSGQTGFCFDPERLLNTLNANGVLVTNEELNSINLLQVDHLNGNRLDNGDNQITVCPIFHQAKTKLSRDYLNRYDRNTLEKIE
jgi:hypothetical protein